MPETNWVPCPKCKGKKKVPVDRSSSVMMTCPRCKGQNGGKVKVLSPSYDPRYARKE